MDANDKQRVGEFLSSIADVEKSPQECIRLFEKFYAFVSSLDHSERIILFAVAAQGYSGWDLERIAGELPVNLEDLK